MKGTIVGIAPPAPGAAPAPQGLAPPTSDPSSMPSGGSFAPPGGAGAVNPMGSTFVADDKPMAGFPPPSPGFGGGTPFGSAPAQPPAPLDVPAYNPPPAGPGYGAAPAAPGGYDAPPAPGGYGTPPSAPGGYGSPPAPGGYGAPPAPGGYGAPQGYGPPPGSSEGYGAPVQTPSAMVGSNFGMPTDAGAIVPAGGFGPGASGAVGTIRNPVMVLVLTMCSFGLYGLYTMYQIENELHAFLNDGQKSSILWFLFPLLPLLSMPKLMAQARAKAGTPTQGEGNLIAYLFFGMYMIPTDANQVWQQLGARPPA